MSDLFYKCSSLKEVDISHFKFDNVSNLNELFYECSILEKIKVNTNIYTTKKIDTTDMFKGCSNNLIDSMTYFKNALNNIK